MASPAQILSNQQNSQHSTGPRTAEGKRRSSLNATRHGLTGQFTLMPGEDAARFEAFRTALLAELAPEGTVEDMLAQSICETQWRLERARRQEANILALPHYEDLPASIESIEDPAERAAMIEAYAATKYERALRNINIQEGRLTRSLSKALDDYRKEQLRRRVKKDDDFTEAINARTYHQATEQPFDPAALGFVFTTPEIDAEIESRYMQDNPFSTTGVPKVRTHSEQQESQKRHMDQILADCAQLSSASASFTS